MKFLSFSSSSSVILSLLTLSLLSALDEVNVVGEGDAGVRQMSQPMRKAIKRPQGSQPIVIDAANPPKYAPVVESPPAPRMASDASFNTNRTGAPKAAAPTFQDDDFMKRLMTDMEEFDKQWAQRRGVKADPAMPKIKNPSPAGQQQQPSAGKQADMDALLEKSGLKDVVTPFAESLKSGGDFKESLRQASQQLFGAPGKLEEMAGSPEVQKLMEQFGGNAGKAIGDSVRALTGAAGVRQPSMADLFADFGKILGKPSDTPGAGQQVPGQAGKKTNGLEDLLKMFENPPSQKAGQQQKENPFGGLEDLLGDFFNKAPNTAGSDAVKRNKPSGKHTYGAAGSSSHYQRNVHGRGASPYSTDYDESEPEWSMDEL